MKCERCRKNPALAPELIKEPWSGFLLCQSCLDEITKVTESDTSTSNAEQFKRSNRVLLSHIDRFDKFTEQARKVVSFAQEEARLLQHTYIGTEHLLLGLIREEEGVAAKVLANLGVELNKVRSFVESIISRGDRIVLVVIGLTPRAKKVIELAIGEASILNHDHIGTEHLLLGLVREEGIGAAALESLGVSLEKVRKTTSAVLEKSETVSQQKTHNSNEGATIQEALQPSDTNTKTSIQDEEQVFPDFTGKYSLNVQRGADLHYSLTVAFKEAVFGCSKEIEVPRWESCSTCRSNGGQSVTSTEPCKKCLGKGRIYNNRRIIVTIPAGVDDGMNVLVTGEGEVSTPGGVPGDLYLVLTVEPHPFFKRQGTDIFYDLTIRAAQATVGCEVSVPTVEGKSTLLKIPPNTQSNYILRIKGMGVPIVHGTDRGDLCVVIKVLPSLPEKKMLVSNYYQTLEIPPDASEEQIKDAYRRLVKRYHPDVNKEEEATKRFIEIQQAYDILIDPIKRKDYDDTNRKEPVKTPPPVEKLYIFPHLTPNSPVTLDFGSITYSLSPQDTNSLLTKGVLRGVLLKTHNYTYYCHRCCHQWETSRHSQSSHSPNYCPKCHADDWSEFLLLRCSHCVAVFESEGDIREKVLEDQKGKLFSPYEVFPRCPNCKRSRWCLDEEEKIRTQQQQAQPPFRSEKDQQKKPSSSESPQREQRTTQDNAADVANLQEDMKNETDDEHVKSAFRDHATSQEAVTGSDTTFEKFTKEAIKALSLAQEEALRFQRNAVNTEHLLLALVTVNEGIAAQVLRSLGVKLDAVRRNIEVLIGRRYHATVGEPFLSPRLQQVIELAIDEARSLNHQYIGTEHLLLGLVREGAGIEVTVLNNLGISLETVRETTIAALQQRETSMPYTATEEKASVRDNNQTDGGHTKTENQHSAASQQVSEEQKESGWADEKGSFVIYPSSQPRQERKYSRRLVAIGLLGAGFAACYSFGRVTLALSSQTALFSAYAPQPQISPASSPDKSFRRPDEISAVALSPNGELIAYTGTTSYKEFHGVVSIFSHKNMSGIFSFYFGGIVETVAWASNGIYVAAGTHFNEVQIWDVAQQKQVAAYGKDVTNLAWSPDNKYIVSGDDKDRVQVWETSTGNVLYAFTDDQLAITPTVAWSPNGKRIASSTANEIIKIWDAPTGGHTITCTCSTSLDDIDLFIPLDWSPDSTRIVSGANNIVQVWNADNGSLLLQCKGHTDQISCIKWSPNGNFVASGSWDKTVRVWNVSSGEGFTSLILTGHTEAIEGIAWSPDSQFLFSVSNDVLTPSKGSLRIWDISTGQGSIF